jgi:hypothetical protein
MTNNETSQKTIFSELINKYQSIECDQLPAFVSHNTQPISLIPSAISSIPVQSETPFFQILKEMSSIKQIAFDPVDVKIGNKKLTQVTLRLVIDSKIDAPSRKDTDVFDNNGAPNQELFKKHGNKFQEPLKDPLLDKDSMSIKTREILGAADKYTTATETTPPTNLTFNACGLSKREARLNVTVKALRHLLFMKDFFSDRQLRRICAHTVELLAKHRHESALPLIESPQCISFLAVLNEIGFIKQVRVGNYFDHKYRKRALRVSFLFNEKRENFYCNAELEEEARLWGTVRVLMFFLKSPQFVSLFGSGVGAEAEEEVGNDQRTLFGSGVGAEAEEEVGNDQRKNRKRKRHRIPRRERRSGREKL